MAVADQAAGPQNDTPGEVAAIVESSQGYVVRLQIPAPNQQERLVCVQQQFQGCAPEGLGRNPGLVLTTCARHDQTGAVVSGGVRDDSAGPAGSDLVSGADSELRGYPGEPAFIDFSAPSVTAS